MRHIFDDETTKMQQNEYIEFLSISNQQKTFNRKQLFEAMLRLDLENIYFAIVETINKE